MGSGKSKDGKKKDLEEQSSPVKTIAKQTEQARKQLVTAATVVRIHYKNCTNGCDRCTES